MSSSLQSFDVLVLVLLSLGTTSGVNACSVTPAALAVVTGNDLSLTCTPQSVSGAVDSWRLESDANSAMVLYQAPSLYTDGSIRIEKYVAEGYLVNDSNPRQIILTIAKISTVQANYYYCLCSRSTPLSAFAYVSVLVSEPTFSNSTAIADGKPVTFTCSVSFNGTASTSITIEDSTGEMLNTRNYDEPSNVLHTFSLDYNATANSGINQKYSCNIRMPSDTSKTIIYSRKLNASVQWVPVQNVQIRPVDRTQCLNGEKCAINQTVNCTTEGNPKPVSFQWLTSVNGSGFNMTEIRDDHFTFNTTGKYAVQCIAFNQIIGTTYNSSSSIFTTQVDVNVPSYSASEDSEKINNTPVIVGVVVGVGGFLIIVLVIVIVLIVKRKKSRTVCCNPDDKETRSNQGVELSKHHNGNNSLSTDNGVQNKGFKTSGNDDVTLVENDLYSGKQSKTQIDPSDGGYASVNEVMQQSK